MGSFNSIIANKCPAIFRERDSELANRGKQCERILCVALTGREEIIFDHTSCVVVVALVDAPIV